SLRAAHGPRALHGRQLAGAGDRPDRERHAGAEPDGRQRSGDGGPVPQEDDASGSGPPVRVGGGGDLGARRAGGGMSEDDANLGKLLRDRGLLSSEEYAEAEAARHA